MIVRTRFAPAPTGLLHIGNARTALFNWLFAKHHKGSYVLRIEDTDRERSTQSAIDMIFRGLEWLGLMPDEAPVFQSKKADRHREVALSLFDQKKAYYCQCSLDDLETMRADALAQGVSPKYDRRCLHKGYTSGALRIALPDQGILTIDDQVQGAVSVHNAQLDDFVILRSDGSPTYMVSVVVDDHDMAITHIIRGDDHLTNAFRQTHLYQALGWSVPFFAHIPLIHGPDGAKFSKRHGAPSVGEYQEMGYLPEAMRNYLLRLGWGHKDKEIISTHEAISLFDLKGVGKSPSRFDFKKLNHLNAHYLRSMDPKDLLNDLTPFLLDISPEKMTLLEKGIGSLRQRSTTLVDLASSAQFYLKAPETLTDRGQELLTHNAYDMIKRYICILETGCAWNEKSLESATRQWCFEQEIPLGNLAQIVRVLLTGDTVSPSVFEIMTILGPDETFRRLKRCFSFYS